MSEILDWPQGTPLDVDPALIELDQSPASFFATTITSFTLAGFTLSPLGRRWLGVEPLALVAFTLLHAALYARGVWVLGPRAQSGALWKQRALSFAVTSALAATYGACSSSPASPAYAVLIAAAMVFGQTAPGNVLLVAVLCAVPVAERALFVPSASISSLGVAATAGVASAAMYWTVSARSVRLLRLRTQVASTGALTDLAASREAQLEVAMSLHDGLSGALFAARHRATSTDQAEQVVHVGRSLLLRAYDAIYTCQRGASSSATELEASLQAVARALGVEGNVTVTDSGRALPDEELNDIRDIALEAIANAAHHEVASLELCVELGRLHVRIECQTLAAANLQPGTGRGFRNTLLRAKSRGGDARWGGNAERFASTVCWPAGEVFSSFPTLRVALEIAAAAAFAVALGLLSHGLPGLLAPAVALVFGLYVCVQAGKRLKRAQDELALARAQRRTAEQTPVLRAVDSVLVPPLVQLEQATTESNVIRIRSALTELAHALGDVMWALEWRPEPPLEGETTSAESCAQPSLLSLLSERRAERNREGVRAT